MIRIGDTVKRKNVANSGIGRVIGLTAHAGDSLILVEWEDRLIFPNPSTESEQGLERVGVVASDGKDPKSA